MCRWNAYIGQPLLIDELLYKPKHSLIDESLHARMGAETTNGDGFGIGWYPPDMPEDPARHRSVNPAWNDANLRDLTAHLHSPLFLAHIRAAIGSPVQQTNCHPFRHGRTLLVHNGMIKGFRELRRDLLLAIDPDLFNGVTGSADSEALFYLALTHGLEEDPIGAMEKAIGIVEALAAERGLEPPMQGTIGIADGKRLTAIRYASEDDPRTLFVSDDVDAVRRLHPENERLQQLSEDARIVVSEPLVDMAGAWREIAPSTAITIEGGELTEREFHPQPPV